MNAFAAVGRLQQGTIDEERLTEIEQNACPTCGSCSGMFTANSMNCLSEALGIALPGNGTILAGESKDNLNPERIELWKRAGKHILTLVEQGLKPSDYITKESFDNCVALDIAMAGSTNTVLHLLAIAREAGIDYDCRRIDEISKKVPTLALLSPNGDHHIEDCHRAGGIYAILGELHAAGLLDGSQKTILGQTWDEALATVRSARPAGHPQRRRPPTPRKAVSPFSPATWLKTGAS